MGQRDISRPISRREVLARGAKLAVAGAAVAGSGQVLTACGKAKPTAVPKSTLDVGAGQDQYVLSGARANLSAYPLNANVIETLTYLTPSYGVQPLLAERWELRPPNTWRFFLRRGVRFHDGRVLDAAAVKEGLFDRLARQPGGSTINAGPASTVVVDDHTVDFTPTTLNLRVPQQVVHPENGVIAPGSDPGSRPVGTGPFKFVDYAPKQLITVVRNPDYWGEKAKLERINFHFYPDAISRDLALEAGNIAFAFEVPRTGVASLRSKGLVVRTSPVGGYAAMYANIHGKAPYGLLGDLRLRQAVEHAVDRRALVNHVLGGLATTDQTMVPPGVLAPYASLVHPYSYDPARSKALLESAGWTTGPGGIRAKGRQALKLTLVSGFPSAEAQRPIPTFLQSQLRSVGIDLAVVEVPDTATYDATIASGHGDLFIEQGHQNDANPGFLPVLLFYSAGTGASGPYQSLFAPGPAFDRLIRPSLTSPDPHVVRKATAQAMAYLIDDDAVVVPLAGLYNVYAMTAGVQGFVPHPSDLSVRWAPVSLR